MGEVCFTDKNGFRQVLLFGRKDTEKIIVQASFEKRCYEKRFFTLTELNLDKCPIVYCIFATF
jgi:hypothetical protein